MLKPDYDKLQNTLGYQFKDLSVLKLALTHSSFAHERPGQTKGQYNERIEYLGDAVLELIVSDYLYYNYPEKSEGEMTRTRASLVCEFTLAACAREISLGEYIFLCKGEDVTGGRKRDSILSDAFEAILGAIYVDGGFEPARAFISRILLKDIEHKQLFYDSKTCLQELVQAKKNQQLQYVIVKESGPEHNKQFVAEVQINGAVIAEGKGHSKKTAEQQAAYAALLKLKGKEKGQ